MASGDIWRFDMIGFGPDGEELVNVLHYQEIAVEGDGITLATVVEAATAIESGLIDPYLNCIPSGYTYDHSVLTKVVGTPLLTGESFSNAGAPGNHPDAPSVIERCGLIQKRTGVSGRNGRGRIFLPMAPVTYYTYGGILITAGTDVLTVYGAFAESMLASIAVTAATMNPCLFHRTTSTALVLTDFAISNLVGVQRRRRQGVGS
jgi:hypothetical protein